MDTEDPWSSVASGRSSGKAIGLDRPVIHVARIDTKNVTVGIGDLKVVMTTEIIVLYGARLQAVVDQTISCCRYIVHHEIE